jgi:hypothetical protein
LTRTGPIAAPLASFPTFTQERVVQCIVPPYIVEQMARSEDPRERERAMVSLAHAAAVRAAWRKVGL